MSLDYKPKEIVRGERISEESGNIEPFAGYISPSGDIISFYSLFGGTGHEDWRNQASWAFVNFVYFIVKECPYQKQTTIKGIKSEELTFWSDRYKMTEFMKLLNEHLRWYKGQMYDPYCHMAYDILKIFKLAYQNGSFFETIGQEIRITSFPEWIVKQYHYDWSEDRQLIDDKYLDYNATKFYEELAKRELMTFFKEFVVRYLEYDTIERISPDIKKVDIKERYDGSYSGRTAEDYMAKTPRIITTSSTIPNERFYNYLLMDWVVQRVPKFIYNNDEHRFQEESTLKDFYKNEKEEILAEEIASVKRLVPLHQRHNYFRR